MIGAAPHLPWSPAETRAALRGVVVVKLAAGEAPERIPTHREVRRGTAVAAGSLDGGRLDAAIRKHSPALRAMRAFSPAGVIGGVASARWSELEDATGLSRTFRVEVDPDADLLALLDALGSVGSVEHVSPVYLAVTPFEAALESASDPWYAERMIGAREALEFEPGDSALLVGIVDSGVDLEHPELKPALRPGFNAVDLSPDAVPRAMRLVGDFARRDRLPQDGAGHGTACAGIIAARGIRLPRGIGGAAQLIPLRALGAAVMVGRAGVTAVGSLLDIDIAVKLGIDLGARVLNLSFGTPESALRPGDAPPHADVVEYARRHGCVLVAASGNDGKRGRYFPACLDGVIAVGSVGPDGRPSHFSTRGDHVDLCAPGEAIPSTRIGGYQLNTGTSFAAPFVTGACALLAARAARYVRPVDGEWMRELLKRTARPFPRGANSAGCGAGILDVPAALHRLEQELSSSGDESSGWDHPAREPPEVARAP